MKVSVKDRLLQAVRARKHRQQLQAAIKQCQSVEELRKLVYQTQNKDEDLDRAFVRRLEQLEAKGQQF